MSKIIYAYPYRKNGIKVPNYYPSFELEWRFFGKEKNTKVDIFNYWFLAEQMLKIRKIMASKRLTKNEKFLEKQIQDTYQGNYIDYLYTILMFKYRWKSEYQDLNNSENDFFNKIDRVVVEEKIKNFIYHQKHQKSDFPMGFVSKFLL